MKLKIAAKIVLSRDDKVLLVADPSGKWDFPGGGLENDETWEQGLRRELKEELGLTDFNLGSVVHADDWMIASKDLHVYCIFFRGTLDVAHEATLSDEHSQAVFLTPQQVREHDVTPDTIRTLEALGL